MGSWGELAQVHLVRVGAAAYPGCAEGRTLHGLR